MVGQDPRLDAIVLAAGAGRRFGGGKLLARFEGRPLIAGALDAALSAPVRAVVLMTDGDLALAAVARDHALRCGRGEALRVVVVDDAAEGMAASLRRGVASLSPDSQGVFVFLGDMPRIPVEAPSALARRFARDTDLLAPGHEGRRGHPVLFGAAWFPALAALSGDRGAQGVLQAAGERLDLVDGFDAGVLFDVDHVADLAG